MCDCSGSSVLAYHFLLRVGDTANTRCKMYFSTSFSDIKTAPLHCHIPVSMVGILLLEGCKS
jgi:hypothetical protein